MGFSALDDNSEALKRRMRINAAQCLQAIFYLRILQLQNSNCDRIDSWKYLHVFSQRMSDFSSKKMLAFATGTAPRPLWSRVCDRVTWDIGDSLLAPALPLHAVPSSAHTRRHCRQTLTSWVCHLPSYAKIGNIFINWWSRYVTSSLVHRSWWDRDSAGYSELTFRAS